MEYAAQHIPLPNLLFAAASLHRTPFRRIALNSWLHSKSIEHLHDYRAFLKNARELVTPQGLFIVSSPNKNYYAESRARTGPNPFHEHEFEADEFVTSSSRVFSNVRLLLENRVESFAFHPAKNILAGRRAN